MKELADMCGVSDRTVRGWLAGGYLPIGIAAIEREFFGGDPGLEKMREELRGAWSSSRSRKAGLAYEENAEVNWVVDEERFGLEQSERETDKSAAINPLRQQLQNALCITAAELADVAGRLSNSSIWHDLSKAAGEFHSIAASDPLGVTERLGEAYALVLKLGRFLETDTRVRQDSTFPDVPLDPIVHGLLTDLIRIGAPWLRGFPSVAEWDDAAGRALTRAARHQDVGSVHQAGDRTEMEEPTNKT